MKIAAYLYLGTYSININRHNVDGHKTNNSG